MCWRTAARSGYLMLTSTEDGRLQVTAAASLLQCSRLVEWNSEAAVFRPIDRDYFELAWQIEVDPVFGRLISWILFAAGAEFLAKGVCLLNGVEIRTRREVPDYPCMAIHEWAEAFLRDAQVCGTLSSTHFGTLSSLTLDHQIPAALKRLVSTVSATREEKNILLAAYELLRRTIRNRDAHAYVPNVRDSHYWLVPRLFADVFNLLLRWLPGGAATLTAWKAEASSFIASL
jgi:hypothetical protein